MAVVVVVLLRVGVAVAVVEVVVGQREIWLQLLRIDICYRQMNPEHYLVQFVC